MLEELLEELKRLRADVQELRASPAADRKARCDEAAAASFWALIVVSIVWAGVLMLWNALF